MRVNATVTIGKGIPIPALIETGHINKSWKTKPLNENVITKQGERGSLFRKGM